MSKKKAKLKHKKTATKAKVHAKKKAAPAKHAKPAKHVASHAKPAATHKAPVTHKQPVLTLAKPLVDKKVAAVSTPAKKAEKKKGAVTKFVALNLTASNLSLEERVQKIIDTGRERGFLTYEELNINIPESVTSAGKLDEILGIIEEVNIQIVEDPSDFKPEKKKLGAAAAKDEAADSDEERDEPENVVKPITDFETYGSSNDPVRMYLKKMGEVSLLTREGEVEVAKRIEHWEQRVFEIILSSALVRNEIFRVGEEIKKGDTRIFDVIKELDEQESGAAEDQQKVEEEYKAKVHKLLTKVKVLSTEFGGFDKKAHSHSLKDDTRKGYEDKRNEIQSKMIECLRDVNFNRSVMNGFINCLKDVIEEIDGEEKIINENLRKLGLKSGELELAKKIPANNYLQRKIGKETSLSREQILEIADVIINAQKKTRKVETKYETKVEDIKKTYRELKYAEQMVDKAKGDLVEANLRLVVSIAKKYTNRGLQFLDLIQEGNIGLMKAVDKFEYKRGYKFSTYATWWIRQAITRAIADQARTIRIPVHMIETINRLVRTTRQLVQELGREPSPEEIAFKMEMPVEKVRKVLKIAKEPISLETPIGEEEDSYLGDFIEDKLVMSPNEAALNFNLSDQTKEVLETLTPREEKVLRMRFGISEKSDHTLEEVGRDFNVTRERIRQIEAKALRKLRHPSRAKKLRSFVDW